MGPVINRRQHERVLGYIQRGLEQGARLVAGGGRPAHLPQGWFVEPTLFADVDNSMTIAQEEIFGPVLSVVPVDGYDAAMTAANQVRYGLSASIFTRDVNTAFRAMRDFETGIVYVNAGTTGAETHLPFGGWKQTGNGHREAGHAALDTFTEWKAVYVDYSGRLQRAQIDNQ
jgi:aldehyde dehydrogenase (NAD+)